jgi:predicted RNase H-related nuclease YkuK (DUF458 family)
MENFLERKWLTIEDKSIGDVVTVLKEAYSQGPHEVLVGTDSQQDRKSTQFVSVIVLLKPGKGGRAFYIKETVPRIRSLRERLMKEVLMSVQIGIELNEHIPETAGLTVHIDANPNVRFKSSEHVKELVSMVVGQGFKAVTKPDGWAAMHVADHTVKQVVGR